MTKTSFYILLLFVLFGDLMTAQQATVDSVKCEFNVTEAYKDKLNKMPYVYAKPHPFRVYNSEKEYASLHFVRRRSTGILVYLKIFVFNTCIHKDYKIELTLANGGKRKIKNHYGINCDGIFVRNLTPKDVRILRKNQLVSFTVQTYEKNYEFHVNDSIAERIHEDLTCLTKHKF